MSTLRRSFDGGAEIDFIDDETGTGFQIKESRRTPAWTDPLADKVQTVIDSLLTPALAQHGVGSSSSHRGRLRPC